MDRSDWIILGLLISVIIALSVDFSIGLKYLDTEIKADFNQNFDIKAVDARESKSFIISEGGSFNAGEKTLDGDCVEAQGVNNRLLENTYIDDNDWSESSALSKLKFSIMSNENVEDIKTFNKSSTTDIRDISVMNGKAYILLESLAYGCGRKGEGSHLVIINDKGEIERRKALNNLSGNPKVLKHVENGALYILSSRSIGKYSREGENYWMKDLSEDSSYKAKVFDVDDNIYVGLMSNNLNKFRVQKISRLGEKLWKNEGEDFSSLETTLTSLKITEENELLAVTHLVHDSSGYLDLGIEKLADGTGDRKNKAIIDTKGPTNEEKGQILTKNNEDQIIISRIEREEFGKNELGNYDHVSNSYTGLIELNKDHDSFETFITREKYIDPNKVFQMNESLYATSGSKLLKLEKEVKPFKPKFEWDFPLWMRLNVPMDYTKPYEG